MSDLGLHEQVWLLSWRRNKRYPITHSFALGAGCLATLCSMGKLSIEKNGRKTRVNVLDPFTMGDPALDHCLQEAARRKRLGSAENWIVRFGSAHTSKNIAMNLCRKGILITETVRSSFLFTREIYHLLDPRPKSELIAELRELIFGDSDSTDAQTATLLAIVSAGNLLWLNFDRNRLKVRKHHISQLVLQHEISDEISKAVHNLLETQSVAPLSAAV